MKSYLERVLLVYPDKEFCEILENTLAVEGFRVESVYNPDDALLRVSEKSYKVVVLPLVLPEMNGVQVMSRLKEMRPGMHVIVISDTGTVGAAVESLKAGAFDVINKPILMDDVIATIKKAFHTKERWEEGLLRDEKKPLIGVSRAMRDVNKLISKAAPTDSTVLIIGESGTGKEIIAHSIYKNSLRKNKPFVKISCAALPETLLESELFGYVKGAFTGAGQAKKGLFEIAHGGTLFLDEIGEVSPRIQAKLLRALQEKEIRPVGGTEDVEVDVRFIAATNRNLNEEMDKGNFREDLFYRLNVINIQVPPLRERKEDIPLLVDYFLKKYTPEDFGEPKSVNQEVLNCFVSYDWSGNVRELENIIERAIILGAGSQLTLQDIPKRIQDPGSGFRSSVLETIKNGDGVLPLNDAVDALERDLIMRAMRKTKGVTSRAAKLLKIKRTTLIAKMKKLGLK